MVKNWRAISLINVDVELASKTLTNARAFVKGRTIFDAVRTIDDMIEHAKYKDITGILVAIDFEKAFDSLNFNFL